MKQQIAALVAGVLFALGLGLSGMTQPNKVLGFLDLAAWDPTLLFVMIGAIGVHAPLSYLIRRRTRPVLDEQWHVPTRRDVTPQLITGAALFGIGWGLAGYCPGPAVVALVSGISTPLIFVSAMALGMGLHAIWRFISPRSR